MKDTTASLKTLEVKVRQEHHRHIIGRGGVSLAKIQDASGAVVIIPVGAKPAAATAAVRYGKVQRRSLSPTHTCT